MVERVWGKDVFLDTDNAINAVIRRIRLVLDDCADQPAFYPDGDWQRISFCSRSPGGRRFALRLLRPWGAVP